jgi:hypothetical protein
MLTKKQTIRLALQGIRGKNWYHKSSSQIADYADRRGYDKDTVCAILAITSPRVAVTRNVRIAMKYMSGRNDWNDGVMGSIRKGVTNYEDGKGINGPKTSAFYANLMGCGDSICLDSWMARAFGVPIGKVTQVAVSKPIKARIRFAANKLGWSNAETQAAIWTAIMAEAGRKDQPYCIEQIEQEIHDD